MSNKFYDKAKIDDGNSTNTLLNQNEYFYGNFSSCLYYDTVFVNVLSNKLTVVQVVQSMDGKTADLTQSFNAEAGTLLSEKITLKMPFYRIIQHQTVPGLMSYNRVQCILKQSNV